LFKSGQFGWCQIHSIQRAKQRQQIEPRRFQTGAKVGGNFHCGATGHDPSMAHPETEVNGGLRYQEVQRDILETFLDRGELRKLAEPTVLANGKRIPGLKLDHPRQLALMSSLVRFSHVAAGGSPLQNYEREWPKSSASPKTPVLLGRYVMSSRNCAPKTQLKSFDRPYPSAQ
jgi:hypothetical protein